MTRKDFGQHQSPNLSRGEVEQQGPTTSPRRGNDGIQHVVVGAGRVLQRPGPWQEALKRRRTESMAKLKLQRRNPFGPTRRRAVGTGACVFDTHGTAGRGGGWRRHVQRAQLEVVASALGAATQRDSLSHVVFGAGVAPARRYEGIRERADSKSCLGQASAHIAGRRRWRCQDEEQCCHQQTKTRHQNHPLTRKCVHTGANPYHHQ